MAQETESRMRYGPMERRSLGACPVDSGELIIIDPCYVNGPIEMDTPSEPRGPYRTAWGGVTFPPGVGDGVYEVVAYERELFSGELSWGKRVVKVEILCVPEALEP